MSQYSNLNTQIAGRNLIGLVLCGGQSTRMGSDKGLLLKAGTPWSRIVAGEVEKLGITVYVSVNSSQKTLYQSVFPKGKLIVDSVKSQGPLTGLLSAHAAFPDKDILLVACDMIDIRQETLQQLPDEYTGNPNFDFVAFDNAGITEPLCAIYTQAALSKLFMEFQVENLVSGSLRKILDSGNTKKLISVRPESFKNYNRESDI